MPNVVIPPPEQAVVRRARTYDHPLAAAYAQTGAAALFATLWLAGPIDVGAASKSARMVVAVAAALIIVGSIAALVVRGRRLSAPAPAPADTELGSPVATILRGPGLFIGLTVVVWFYGRVDPQATPAIALGWSVLLATFAVFGALEILQVRAAQRRHGRLLVKNGAFFRAP